MVVGTLVTKSRVVENVIIGREWEQVHALKLPGGDIKS